VVPRLRELDLGRALRDRGFADVAVSDMTAWREAERRMWEAAVEDDADLRPREQRGPAAGPDRTRPDSQDRLELCEIVRRLALRQQLRP
jgi:hypothetical protein